MTNNFYECNEMSYIEKYRYLKTLNKVINVEINRLTDYLKDINKELKKLEN